jgi:hypothetical protein
MSQPLSESEKPWTFCKQINSVPKFSNLNIDPLKFSNYRSEAEMEAQTRADLTATSVQTKNKKLLQILESREFFVQSLNDLKQEIGDKSKSCHESTDAAMVSFETTFSSHFNGL